jgi:linker histone H1 and H5 family
MIIEAITYLKERTGSSPYAIGKFIEDKAGSLASSNF